MPKNKPSRASKMILDATLCPDGVYRITKPAEPKTYTHTFTFGAHSFAYDVSESPGTYVPEWLSHIWIQHGPDDDPVPYHNTST